LTFSHGTRNRLTAHDLDRFTGDTLFDRIGRVVCGVGRLPRKELYEAWEVARRVRRWCRGGRVIDVAGGHGLLAHIMLLLDDSSLEAVVVDPALPLSATPLHEAFVAAWPRLHGRVRAVACGVDGFAFERGDVVVSSHACGALTDAVLAAAVSVRAAVGVLPCCHHLSQCDPGPLRGWLDGSLAVDVMRAVHLETAGYTVRTQQIPEAITAKNRLLIGVP